jgi:hypothetical protein
MLWVFGVDNKVLVLNTGLKHSGSFEEHRRKHYDNEFKKAKILLATDPALAMDDDDAAANGEAESSSAAVAK